MAVVTGSSYEEAVLALEGLITRIPAIEPPLPGCKLSWTAEFEDVFKHIRILELEDPLARMSIIHVAGTKGKGSTCAFAESMLRASGFRTGLFTSPHLVDVCERFRFDGLEVTRDVFAHNFWWCYDRLQANTDIVPMPGFFRFLTLLALRMFSVEKVDVVILEVGLGGRLDATNLVRAPAVCGISSLGFDHMDILGNTLREIAGEKAGIFKAGVPAVTAPQPQEAMEALQIRAQELQIPLTLAPSLESYELPSLKLGLNGEHQRVNAALAIALCKFWAQRSGNEDHWKMAAHSGGLPEPYIRGLESTKWPGRAEIIPDTVISPERESSLNANEHHGTGKLQFYLDGAHSPESMEACAKWFVDTVKTETVTPNVTEHDSGEGTAVLRGSNSTEIERDCFRRVLLFNCMPKRDPQSLLPPLVNRCYGQGLPFHMAFFTSAGSSHLMASGAIAKDRGERLQAEAAWQLKVQRLWESLHPLGIKELTGESFCTVTAANGRSNKELYVGLDEQKGVCHTLGSSSAVMSSLPGTLEWIRSCARRHPRLQIQVLVTGSLYLVGDMLKLLKH